MRQWLLLGEGMQRLSRLFRSRRAFVSFEWEVVWGSWLRSSLTYSPALWRSRSRVSSIFRWLQFFNTVCCLRSTQLCVRWNWPIIRKTYLLYRRLEVAVVSLSSSRASQNCTAWDKLISIVAWLFSLHANQTIVRRNRRVVWALEMSEVCWKLLLLLLLFLCRLFYSGFNFWYDRVLGKTTVEEVDIIVRGEF